ncbi:MAG: adenosylcobinamide-GDP ribazoletransferase [Pseudomonadota bacterium]
MRQTIRVELGLLAHAVQFLTRMPVPSLVPHQEDLLGRAARYFPIVGAFVGLIATLPWVLAHLAGLPPLVCAGLSLSLAIYVTGGLHEDGLADCADGLGGGATRARALEIMRDSRIGTYGALALVLSLILRVSALASLPVWAGAAALIVVLAVGRMAIVYTLLLFPYARPEGLASGAARAEGGVTALVATAIGAGLALALGHVAGAAALLAGAGVWAWFSWRLMRRLGGYTGDGLGATEQLVQIAALLAMAAVWA